MASGRALPAAPHNRLVGDHGGSMVMNTRVASAHVLRRRMRNCDQLLAQLQAAPLILAHQTRRHDPQQQGTEHAQQYAVNEELMCIVSHSALKADFSESSNCILHFDPLPERMRQYG